MEQYFIVVYFIAVNYMMYNMVPNVSVCVTFK